jgi:hypothetical protein
LAKALKGDTSNTKTAAEEEKTVVKGGSAQAMVPQAWDVVLNMVFRNMDPGEGTSDQFSRFWIDVVDGEQSLRSLVEWY